MNEYSYIIYQNIREIIDNNGKNTCRVDDDGDPDDDESYSEDKEANSELQTKVITAIDN